MKVEITNLSRHFGHLRAVDRAEFAFESGSVFGFIGPNGAGKTTTLRMLATLDVPTSGDALFDGVSVVHYPDRVRRLIGFMPDTLDAYADMTVTEYLDFFARSYGLRGDERRRRMADIMDFTDLGPLAWKLTNALSKGMKQRLSLARALIHDPEVLLLDEPAAGLDPRARVELRELIKLLGERGKAVLVSSHILTELSEICNGVVIIEKGSILATGSTEEIEGRAKRAERVVVALAAPESGGEPDLRAVQRHLLEQPRVDEVVLTASGLEFTHAGPPSARAGFLAGLVREGFAVSEYWVKETGLEDLFLRVTKGEVS